VVQAIGEQFDAMWNSDWAIPIDALMVFTLSEEEVRERYRLLRAFAGAAANRPYPLPDSRQAGLQLLRSRLERAVWAPAEFVYNPPAITAGDETSGSVIANRLRELAEAANTDILIESAYFIVTDETLELVEQLIDRDVRIAALTNSLSTTDVWLIHSGYTRNREEVIRSGVKLYEFRPDAASCMRLVESDHHDCKDFKFSLHAKSVVFDRRLVFVGSFNLNPRSRLLNTETALIVHSPVLAEQIARDIEENLQPENSWQVVINDAGRLEWHARTDGMTSVVSHEPATGMWTRFKSYIFSFFPVEKYL
jgi:putative cardiolipin synthase